MIYNCKVLSKSGQKLNCSDEEINSIRKRLSVYFKCFYDAKIAHLKE